MLVMLRRLSFLLARVVMNEKIDHLKHLLRNQDGGEE
jgi:hypothetical protein